MVVGIQNITLQGVIVSLQDTITIHNIHAHSAKVVLIITDANNQHNFHVPLQGYSESLGYRTYNHTTQTTTHHAIITHVHLKLMQFITPFISLSPVGSEWPMLYADLANRPGYL